MAESFFATLKTEFYHRRVWPTQAGAKLAVGAWIEDRYNRRRRHSALGQLSPVTFEMTHCTQTAAVHKPLNPVSTVRGQGHTTRLPTLLPVPGTTQGFRVRLDLHGAHPPVWRRLRWFSFPFPRAAGKPFIYNEFCLVAVKPG